MVWIKYAAVRPSWIRCHSGKQHGKSRPLVVVASADPQFTANLSYERSNDPHSQSFAGAGVEPFRQGRAIIGNRKRVAMFRSGLQPDGDPAFAVFSRIGDQLAGDEAKRNR